jgi:hypothetical protein
MKMKLLSAFDSWMHVPKEYMLLISRMAQIVHRAGLL